jgi:hypothetical protein
MPFAEVSERYSRGMSGGVAIGCAGRQQDPGVTGLRTFVVAIYRTSGGCSCNAETPG